MLSEELLKQVAEEFALAMNEREYEKISVNKILL